MARPSLASPARIYRVTLCLHDGEDDDLIEFLDRVPSRGRARAIVAAMRAGGVTAVANDMDSDDDELFAALDGMMF